MIGGGGIKFQSHKSFLDLVKESKGDLTPGREIVVKIHFSNKTSSELVYKGATETGALEFINLQHATIDSIYLSDIKSVEFVCYASELGE